MFDHLKTEISQVVHSKIDTNAQIWGDWKLSKRQEIMSSYNTIFLKGEH